MKNKETTKMTWGKSLLHVLLWSSTYFTAITLALLVTQAFNTDTYVSPVKFLLIYPFALIMGLGNLIIKSPLKVAEKTFLHCLITIGGLYAFLIYPSRGVANAVVVLLVFAAIYFVIATPILIVLRIKRKKAEETAPYQPMFTKQKSKKG